MRYFHWFSFITRFILSINLSNILLATFITFVLVGLINLHLMLLGKSFLWSFNVIKASCCYNLQCRRFSIVWKNCIYITKFRKLRNDHESFFKSAKMINKVFLNICHLQNIFELKTRRLNLFLMYYIFIVFFQKIKMCLIEFFFKSAKILYKVFSDISHL